MNRKLRVAIPTAIREQLALQCGLKCPVPTCSHELGLDIHHIDGSPSNNNIDNLLMLCAVHHRAAHEGRLTRRMCRSIKQFLAGIDPPFGPASRRLPTRTAYLETAIAELRQTVYSFRSVYVGPLFLHPAWYHNIRTRQFGTPNYDAAVFKHVKKVDNTRRQQTKIILRNTPRYIEKVNGVVEPTRKGKFKNDILKAVDEIWGRTGAKGPLICCVDTGILRIPLIHDQSCIVAVRGSVSTPITSGYIYTKSEDVAREREMYDTIFSECWRGQKDELDKLKTFINSV